MISKELLDQMQGIYRQVKKEKRDNDWNGSRLIYNGAI